MKKLFILLTVLATFGLAVISGGASPTISMTISVAQRLGVGTVPDGTKVTITNQDGSALPGTPPQTTVSGVVTYPVLPFPTAPNSTYKIVVSLPTGAKGVPAVLNNVNPGDQPTIYFTAIEEYVAQAVTAVSPVAFATCIIDGVSVNTGISGLTQNVWLPDGAYTTTYSFSSGVQGTCHFTLGATSSSFLAPETDFVQLDTDLTRINLTARLASGFSYIPTTGAWSVYPTGYSVAVNGTVISPSIWLPNGMFIGYVSGSASAGAEIFNVGTPTASGTRNVLVSPSTGWLIGKVSNQAGSALNNIAVSAVLSGNLVAQTTTDSCGYYVLQTPPGTYCIQFSDPADIYETAKVNNEALPIGSVETLNQQLIQFGGLQGLVADQNGAPMANFQLTISYTNGTTVETINTDGNGNYFTRLPAGSYDIYYNNGIYDKVVGPFTFGNGQFITENITDQELGEVSGTITSVGYGVPNFPLEGVTVIAYQNGTAVAGGIFDFSGGYYGLDLPVGTYNVQYTYTNYITVNYNVTISYGIDQSYSFAMTPDPGTANIHEQDNTGLEVSGTSITFQSSFATYHATTDTNGNVSVSMPPGNYIVTAAQNGLVGGNSINIGIGPNGSTGATIVVNPSNGGVNVFGRVTSNSHPNGYPNELAQIEDLAFFEVTNTHTDGGGVYRLNFNQGSYWVFFADTGVGDLAGPYTFNNGNTYRIDYQISKQ